MKIIEDLGELFIGKLNFLKALATLIRLEGRLAMLSILPLLFSLFALGMIVSTLWATCMLGIGYYITWIFSTVAYGFLSVLFLNIILFFILYKYLLYNIKQMSFEKTKHYFSQQETKKQEDKKHVAYEKNVDKTNNRHGPTITKLRD